MWGRFKSQKAPVVQVEDGEEGAWGGGEGAGESQNLACVCFFFFFLSSQTHLQSEPLQCAAPLERLELRALLKGTSVVVMREPPPPHTHTHQDVSCR